MMRHMKKMVCFLLAAIMMLAMCTTVMADEPATPAGTNSIKVENPAEKETYRLYKMLDLSADPSKDAYSYTVNPVWTDFFTGNGDGREYVTIDPQGYVTWNAYKNSDDAMEAFGKAAAKYVNDKKLTELKSGVGPEPVEGANTEIVFDKLDAGYYLITSTYGTLAMVYTTPQKDAVVVHEKTESPTIDKKIVYGTELETEVVSKNAQIGDTIQYKLTVEAKKGAKDYVIIDEMDLGLTLDQSSIVVKAGKTKLTENNDYSIAYSDRMEAEEGTEEQKKTGTIMTITFKNEYLKSITEDTTITVEYSATLNKDVLKNKNAINKATLKYGSAGTVEESAKVTTYQFNVLKYDAEDNSKKPLAGATFELYRGDNTKPVNLVKVDSTTYRVADSQDAEMDTVTNFTTVADDVITIQGVDAADYELEEITAPAGYNKQEEPTKFTVNAGEELTVEIANAKGASLPETGGIGTTIFYVVGSVLVVGAAVLLITKKRMKAND